jgi:hypothetical protein
MKKNLLRTFKQKAPNKRGLLLPRVADQGVHQSGLVVVQGQLDRVLPNQGRVAVHGSPPEVIVGIEKPASREAAGECSEGANPTRTGGVINHLTDPRLDMVMDERLARLVRINALLKAAFEKR